MAADFTTPTTLLDAVNELLSTIGEAPVNSLGDNLTSDVATAKATLERVSREVQAAGWHFNTEKDYPLVPSEDGSITLPANCVRADIDPMRYTDIDLVQRGSKLYDRLNHTYNIGQTIYADLVVLLDFEELVEAARTYIGSGTLHDFTARDEMMARALLMEAEGDTTNANILSYRGQPIGSWNMLDIMGG
jgi:hypothetical protein